jgi:hypothetical protein
MQLPPGGKKIGHQGYVALWTAKNRIHRNGDADQARNQKEFNRAQSVVAWMRDKAKSKYHPEQSGHQAEIYGFSLLIFFLYRIHYRQLGKAAAQVGSAKRNPTHLMVYSPYLH